MAASLPACLRTGELLSLKRFQLHFNPDGTLTIALLQTKTTFRRDGSQQYATVTDASIVRFAASIFAQSEPHQPLLRGTAANARASRQMGGSHVAFGLLGAPDADAF